MGDVLADAFQAELPCDGTVAASLAARARAWLPRVAGGPEDTDEDFVLRLRDPRIFGAFAETLLADGALPHAVRRTLVEHAFDLLPLPRTEGDVIAVDSRAPHHLLALAVALAKGEGLTVLHVMHLVYAVFLDRSLVTSVSRGTRSAALRSILAQSDTGDNLRALYIGLHLSAVSEAEAMQEMQSLLTDVGVSEGLRGSVARAAASEDGGRSELTRMAQKEGLLAPDLEDPLSPEILANIPRLPAGIAEVGRRYLESSGRL